MPKYVLKALRRFQIKPPSKPVHSPAKFEPPVHGSKVQYSKQGLSGDALPAQSILFIQQVAGVFLYYGRALDNKMLVTINDISHEQSSATTSTMAIVNHFLDYAATHPIAKLRYHKSNMILHVHSDGSYLSVSKSYSRAGGHFFLSNNSIQPHNAPKNGPINVLCTILKNVMSSAAETEIAAAFENAKEAIPIRNTLKFLNHPQPPTPVQVDNTTAVSFANKELKQKRSKAIDMRFYWLQDRVEQKQFHVYWHPGSENYADYYTKHFSTKNHVSKRPFYLHVD